MVEGASELITLQPNETIRLDEIGNEAFLIAEPAERRLQLSYLSNGNRQGLKAWIGQANFEFGADWKDIRDVKIVKATCENGGLTIADTTVPKEWSGALYFDRTLVENQGSKPAARIQ